MAPKASKADKKIAYDAKLCQLLDEYTQILVVLADNVGSTQLQNIRKGLRGDSLVLMGKNTMMKRTVRLHSEKTGNKAFLNLIPLLVGNVGLIFTKGDLKEVSEEVSKYKVGAPARVGLVAPIDVVVPQIPVVNAHPHRPILLGYKDSWGSPRGVTRPNEPSHTKELWPICMNKSTLKSTMCRSWDHESSTSASTTSSSSTSSSSTSPMLILPYRTTGPLWGAACGAAGAAATKTGPGCRGATGWCPPR
ncbi:hypothetical protein ACHQM5_013695 [Ranunculus cassubicifolius]